MIYVFGYGSLINNKSISRTLKREIADEEIYPVKLTKCSRKWRLKETVHSELLQKNVQAVFLDVELGADKKSWCNGVLFGVTDKELDSLILREKNYNMANVSNDIDFLNTAPKKVIVFSAKKPFVVSAADNNLYIMQRYIQMVEEGCRHWGNDFLQSFNDTTQKSTIPVLQGKYVFTDEQQSKNV